jgi:endopolyphosphatase
LGKKKKKGKKGKKGKKPKHPDLTIPSPPSKHSPPGPAYSPQTLTLLGYTQYFANLTIINNEGKGSSIDGQDSKDKLPKPKPFNFEVEYDTFTDPIYKLKDMTVRSYLELAHRIGQYKAIKGEIMDSDSDDHELEAEGKKKKHRKQREKNKVWLEFIRRAYVGSLDDEELQSFELASETPSRVANEEAAVVDGHGGEL